jgi:DNA helicase HerA-like ATPase
VLEDAFQYISKVSANTPSGRTLDSSIGIRNFQEFINWMTSATVRQEEDEELHYLIRRQHDRSTIKATTRRLNNILTGARGVLERDSTSGEPPQVTVNNTCDPIVIDIDGMEVTPQRFVVAAIIERIKQHREKHAERRQRYILVLDELNRFAPKGSNDEITKLFEYVAAQLRSQGVILFGAQQKASSISPLVWENAATKALGRTGAVELSADMWRQTLPATTRSRAASLRSSEKIILQDVFNYPMLTNIPFTPWATRKDEVGSGSSEDDKNVLNLLDFGDE